MIMNIAVLTLALTQAPTHTATHRDLHRAITQCPRAQFKGKDSLKNANQVLNKHLLATSNLDTAPCETFSAKDLQEKSQFLYKYKDHALNEVYDEAKDNRRMIYGSAEEMTTDFSNLNTLVDDRDELHSVLRDGLCHRVVMWYIHHLPVTKQQELAKIGFQLPLLPLAGKRARKTEDKAAQAVHSHYEKSITCQKCHVGGIDSLGVPEVKPTTAKQLARRCYTNYKDLFGITCGPCDGIAGKYWGDNDDKFFTADPCKIVGTPDSIPESERVPAAFPPQFSVDVIAGSDRWGRTTNPTTAAKTPFPPVIDSMYGQISGNWYVDITKDSDLWLLRHDTSYKHVSFNGTHMPLLSLHVSEIHSQTRAQQAVNNTGPMVSIIDGMPDFIPGGCTCVADPVGVPDVAHVRTDGLDEMEFLGRINLTLAEHKGEVVEVDHWANWFFHVFMDVNKSVPHYGKAPRRLASAYAGSAVYDNWRLEDPKTSKPDIWIEGIPNHPERVGPDHGKYCMNPQKIPMCNNIS